MVATPIGNLEDISARALRVLREVAVIAAEDTRRTGNLLARYGITTPTTSFHQHNEQGKAEALIARLQQGQNVALVSDAGTPTLSDPGHLLVRRLLDEGIRVEPIPGPNAAVAALSASGYPASSFTFLGFPPVRSDDRKRWLNDLASAGRPVIFYEAPHRLRTTLEQLQARFGDSEIVVARELTKVHEEFVKGPISHSLSHFIEPTGEFTIILDAGRLPDVAQRSSQACHSDADIADEFSLMTKSRTHTRRQAVSSLAKKYAMPARDVYQIVEKSKEAAKKENAADPSDDLS